MDMLDRNPSGGYLTNGSDSDGVMVSRVPGGRASRPSVVIHSSRFCRECGVSADRDDDDDSARSWSSWSGWLWWRSSSSPVPVTLLSNQINSNNTVHTDDFPKFLIPVNKKKIIKKTIINYYQLRFTSLIVHNYYYYVNNKTTIADNVPNGIVRSTDFFLFCGGKKKVLVHAVKRSSITARAYKSLRTRLDEEWTARKNRWWVLFSQKTYLAHPCGWEGSTDGSLRVTCVSHGGGYATRVRRGAYVDDDNISAARPHRFLSDAVVTGVVGDSCADSRRRPVLMITFPSLPLIRLILALFHVDTSSLQVVV